MKKYIVPIIILILVAAGIVIPYEILAPARGAARDLEAINGITVGKTTEAELLSRPAFEKIDLQCSYGECIYHTQRSNRFLRMLGLAPHTFFATMVLVREGLVTQVSVFMSNSTRPPLFFTKNAVTGWVRFQSVREAGDTTNKNFGQHYGCIQQ